MVVGCLGTKFCFAQHTSSQLQHGSDSSSNPVVWKSRLYCGGIRWSVLTTKSAVLYIMANLLLETVRRQHY